MVNGITKDVFGTKCCPGGGEKRVDRYTLTSPSGVEVQVISLGATISAVLVPDKDGKKDHVVLGFDDVEGYMKNRYQGSTIGRCANRIGRGKMTVEGKQYSLTINNNGNHLHGGSGGWDQQVWQSCVRNESVIFSLLSHDGDDGYPGDVLAQVKYSLDAEGGIRIDYEATTTQATPINMTNHSYFNLAGHAAGEKGLLEHIVRLNAAHFTPVDQELIPTGELAPVRGTAYDLRSPVNLGDALSKAPGNGFDHNFCLELKCRGEMGLAACFVHPPTGRGLEVYTSEAGVQFYTSNFLPKEPNKIIGRNGSSYNYHGAFCCEAQCFPDAVNQSTFPSVICCPGKSYKHSIVYKFFVQK